MRPDGVCRRVSGKHGITSDIERIAPAQINEAFDRVVRGEVKYRFVIDCTKL